MEPLMLTAMVVIYFIQKGKVDSTAYASGKEPPSVAKARMRHERGGGARTASGKNPKGPGAFRLMAASRWANACQAAQQRGEHKAARRRAWYEETAPLKDEKWRGKQLARLNRSDTARAKWAARKGLIDLDKYRERRERRKAEDVARAENKRRDAQAANRKAEEEARAAQVAKRKAEEARAVNKRRNADAPTVATDPPAAQKSTDKPTDTTGSGGRTRDAGDAPATNAPPTDKDGRAEPDGATDEGGSPSWKEILKRTERSHNQPPLPSDSDLVLGNGRSRIDCPVDAPLPESLYPQDGERFDDYLKRLEAAGWKYVRPDPNNPYFIRVAPIGWRADADKDEEPKADEPPQDDGTAGDPEPGSTTATPEEPAQKTGTEGSNTVYMQAVNRLIQQADQVAEYRSQLAAFGDTLAGKGWGVEVTGPIQDMNSQLVTLEGTYRDLATQMKSQGDQGADAYDKAPWVPGPEAVLV